MPRTLILLCTAASLLLAACTETAARRVDLDLTEWAISPSTGEVPAGTVALVAHNRSATMVHEVALYRIEGDRKQRIAEIEDVDPGRSKRANLKLSPGAYELACVITPGEDGSTVDHYQSGMHTLFYVR